MTEPFLSRWSKRKQDAKAAKPVEEANRPAAPPPEGEGAVTAAAPPPELPAIDSLGAESDYSAFLGKDVAPELRQQALLRLWASNPSLMAPEIMDLHMGDYTGGTVMGEVVKTAWRLGKGVLDAAELEAEAQAEADPGKTVTPDRDV